MRSSERTIMTLTLVGVLMMGLGRVGQAQERATGADSKTGHLIWGAVGIPGVTLQGLPGAPVSDETGRYRAHVPPGWSGTVTPTKQGYQFDPPCKRYSAVEKDYLNEDFRPGILTYTISGSVGLAGVALKGLPRNVVTDQEGKYKVTVEYGWAGTVTPVKEGYAFEPERREYSPLTESCLNEDYVVRVLTFRISGNAALPGVVLQGLPGDPVTDAEGNYSVEVPYGWMGKVTPALGGTQVQFHPPSREYPKVTADLSRQDYMPAGASLRGVSPYGAVTPNIVVIPTRETDPKAFVELREDMQVMLQIVREKLSEPRMILGVLYDYGDFFGGRDRTAQAFYLQGHAALFVLDVDFPLVASAPRAGGEQEPPQGVDPVWQRAREKLYTPPNRMRYGARGRASEAERMSFEQFQDEMTKTLKHAANIHAIEPNEWVILTLVGQSEEAAPAGAGGGRGSYSMMGGGGWVEGGAYGGGSFGTGGSVGGRGGFYSSTQGYSGGSAGRVPGHPASGPAAPATVLTIQAKKADSDAFGKGPLEFEQFRQKVKIFTY